MNKLKAALLWFFKSLIWVVIVIIAVDAGTKWACVNTLGIGDQSVTIIKNFFTIHVSINDGAAWSMLAGKRVFWLLVSVVLSIGLSVYYAFTYKKNDWWVRTGIILMIGGAMGNMIDRCFYWPSTVGFDGVIDFLCFQFGSYSFPAFNIADSCLVVGVSILLVVTIIELIKDAIAKGKSGAYSMKPEEYEAKMKAEQEAKEKVEENNEDNNNN